MKTKSKKSLFLKRYLKPSSLIKGYLFCLIIGTNFLQANPLQFTCPYEAPKVPEIDTSKTAEEQIKQIDAELAELKDLKEKYIGKATRFQDQGDRLQFYDDYVTEARRYWDLADCALEIADKIDQEIKMLQLQREKILKKI